MSSLDAELAALDAALAAAGLVIWIGAEPTFTRADSLEPPWLVAAEGGDKEEKARALLVELAARLSPTAALCRTLGRHYPEEPAPRFAFGATINRGIGEVSAPLEPLPAILDGEPIPPPPPSPDLDWMTITPDPAVVEVNLPPAHDLVGFAAFIRKTHDAARAVGLSPLRHRWNGDTTDSGGGGQITFGGASAESSPFFRHPRLLPGLIAYRTLTRRCPLPSRPSASAAPARGRGPTRAIRSASSSRA